MSKTKVTLKDIATELGYSVGLVSLVLRDKWKQNRISEKVAKKVKLQASLMGYKPNIMAQALRTGKSGIIGLIVADIGNTFYGQIVRFVEIEMNKLGYEVMFGSSEENLDNFVNIGETLISRQVDGLIVVPVPGAEESILKWKEEGTPIVSLDRYLENLDIPYFVSDNYYGGVELAKDVEKNGHKKIHYITKDCELSNYKDRERGIRNGFSSDIELIVHSIPFLNYDEELTEILKSNIDSTDAFVFAQNAIGIVALKWLSQKGYSIPKDVAICSFDASDVFELYPPGITCYSQAIKTMVDSSSRALVEMIKNTELRVTSSSIKGEVIYRNSL